MDRSGILNTPEPVLTMRGIGKRFPGVHALAGVDLTVGAGEIVGLVGENGAGKSTLMKILAGAHSRDEGEIVVDGELVGDADPHEMMQRGIAVIYQEPSLADHLTTAENIFMGRLPTNRFRLIDWKRLADDTAELSRRLGLALEPRVPVGQLSVARRQMVEIAKALSRDARLIVLDEPSAVLGDTELQGLFDVMRRLAANGTAFIYISHRLAEVFTITDRVTVMKDGRVVTTERTGDLTPERLVRAMVGRDVRADIDRSAAALGDEALAVRGLTRRGVIDGRRVRRAGRRDPRASPGSPARDAPRCCGRSSAPIRSTPARSRSSGSRLASASPATRSTSGSGC